jgi:hypothetical protein
METKEEGRKRRKEEKTQPINLRHTHLPSPSPTIVSNTGAVDERHNTSRLLGTLLAYVFGSGSHTLLLGHIQREAVHIVELCVLRGGLCGIVHTGVHGVALLREILGAYLESERRG